MWRHRRWQALLCIALVMPAAHAATLDAAPFGNDVVFTWDTPGPETILRGTQPDALVPWLVNVTSPVTAPGENLLRGENAFYELASGSNRAWRVELDMPIGNMLAPEFGACLSLPERRSYAAIDLFALWPDLTGLEWWDPVQVKRLVLARFGNAVIGDDASPLPRHGGVRASFARATAITIVGSRDDSYAGLDLADVEFDSSASALSGFPPDALLPTSFQVLCGERGVDWFDVDGDGLPDTCGPDVDGDGFADSGSWRAPVPPVAGLRDFGNVTTWDNEFALSRGATGSIILGAYRFTGSDVAITPGTAIRLYALTPASLHLPFRPPVR